MTFNKRVAGDIQMGQKETTPSMQPLALLIAELMQDIQIGIRGNPTMPTAVKTGRWQNQMVYGMTDLSIH
jgi:hypothetical protein